MTLGDAGCVAGEQNPVSVAGFDQLGNQSGTLGVGDVDVICCAYVVQRDIGAAAGDFGRGAGGDGVFPVESADDDALCRQLLFREDLEVGHRIVAVADGDRGAGGERGAGRSAEQAFLGGGHSLVIGGGSHQSGDTATLYARNHHAIGDFLSE